jgi:hypothetical protein
LIISEEGDKNAYRRQFLSKTHSSDFTFKLDEQFEFKHHFLKEEIKVDLGLVRLR